ncbi:hypothetical protein GCM10029976_050170 [Kribbella albertanoniae]|uniref:Uncharacterized protein n=1 Tax=Kribbella albertanoniae TaxID=1266829 RepID=A0A4R4PRC8_9ACTN|nr:hypothetical protein [Kribbella albertanoniae]TDC24881.1 hypothetical protein E1261_25310 [Kribbella albertanoniae]
MADEAEEMLEILFKQIRKLVRGLDRYRQQLERNRQAQMPRPLIEEIRNIRTHNPDIDRAMNDRPPQDQYARIEQQLQVLREREADLRRQLDDRQQELEANQDLNRDGVDDTSVDDRDERDEVTDDVDERDDQEQQDDRERDEQEQREREEEERRREEEEKRKREEEERKRQEEEKRETGTPNPQLPVGAAAGAAAAPALDDDFDQTAEQMRADYEADREQSRESMEAQRQEIAQQQAEQMENWDGLGNREVMDQMRTEAEQRGELPPRDVAEQVNEAQQNQPQEAPEQEQTETRQEQVQQERVSQEQAQQQEQDQPDQAQDPQEQTQEQVREQEERAPQAQEERQQQAEQDGVDGDGPESRREQETERQQEDDREQADVGTGEGFATGGDHQVANQAAEQAEQPDGRVQAVDQVLERDRLDRENQQGANPQDGSNRPGMSPDEIRQAQEKYSAGTSSPSGAVGSRPNGEALDGARGGQTAGQVHAKTTQRGGREQSGHELKKG